MRDLSYAKLQGEGEAQHVGKILEFFRTTDGKEYFRVQWFYRAEDTVCKESTESNIRHIESLNYLFLTNRQITSIVSFNQVSFSALDWYLFLRYSKMKRPFLTRSFSFILL